MASLDFIRDIEDTLKSQKIDYLIVTLQRGSKNSILDLFHSISDDHAAECFSDTLKQVIEDLETPSKKSKAKKKKKSDENS